MNPGALVLALLLLGGCRSTLERVTRSKPHVVYTEVAHEVGLDTFHQVNGTPEKRHIPETNGAGVALFDYDGDGDLDVFLVNGSRLGGFPKGQEPSNALFRNDDNGHHFVDVTREAGLLSYGDWGQGCAVADVDGDGYPDLYVANYHANRLYHNNGDGSFSDVGERAGVGDPRWSSGATFVDFDRDGDLDLYVANYVEFDAYLARVPGGMYSLWRGRKVMGGPKGLPAAADRFYVNQGDGTFRDATHEVGIDAVPPAYGFQPVASDLDGDGDPDIFVSNDSVANFLWKNNGDGTFTEVGVISGLALDSIGNARAGMGVALDDYDGDGLFDIHVTNFSDQLNSLYHNKGQLHFEEIATQAGVGGPRVLAALGWGTFFFDADNDGARDLFVANGHVYAEADLPDSGTSYAQKNFLFRNLGTGRFEDLSDKSGPGFQVANSARGAAVGDIDNDGDLDIVINNLDATPELLRNDSTGLGHWLSVQLKGKGLNRSAIGAQVAVVAAGRRSLAEVRSSGSIGSVSDLRLHFGLGPATAAERIEVRWPDLTREVVEQVPADHFIVIEEGHGLVATKKPSRPGE